MYTDLSQIYSGPVSEKPLTYIEFCPKLWFRPRSPGPGYHERSSHKVDDKAWGEKNKLA